MKIENMRMIDEFINKDHCIFVGSGKDSYKMSRGSFKTKDKLIEKHYLKFVKEEDDYYLYSDGKVEAKMHFVEENNSLVLKFEVDPRFNRFSFSLISDENEKFYGCGEQFTSLNLKGNKVHIWVSEHQSVMKIAKKCLREKIKGVNPDYKAPYKDHETYFASNAFISSKKYFVDCYSDIYALFHFDEKKTTLSFREVPGRIKIFKEDNFISLSKVVAKDIGISKRIPSWTNEGAILATQGGSEILKQKLDFALNHGVKVSAVWSQDWSGQIVTKFGSQVYWNWEASESLYKDLPSLIDSLHKKNIKFLGYINTFLKRDTPLYNEACKNNYVVLKKNGEVYHIKSTTFDACIVDLTNPKAYEWYKNIIKKNMIEYGLDGWMVDFGEYLPTDSCIYGGEAEAMHNLWPSLWVKLNQDAIKEEGKENEIFIFNRAAYKTTIQYSGSMWNGDQHVDYSDEYGLGSVIPSTLSMACCGVGITHSDIGGYTTIMHMKRDEELFKRWSELNVFTPVFRCHEGNRPASNVQFDDEKVIDHFKNMSLIFTSLKPYSDHLKEIYYKEGIPFNRPLFFHYDEEWCYEEQKEFMMGDEVIVSPVLRPHIKTKEVHLPKGKWVQFFTNKEFEGGIFKVDTPLGRPIAFYKKDGQFSELFKNIKGEF